MTETSPHILYVDDEPHIQEVAQMCLEVVGGYQITCLNNGDDLLKKLTTINPDLILLDVMMPQMDGVTTFKALQEKYDSLPPVIFMTARIQVEDIERYMNLGVAGVISKPFDPMTLSEQIKEIWEQANALAK